MDLVLSCPNIRFTDGCLAAPITKEPCTATLQGVKTGYPQQIVAMDILGAFPESQEGNK
jgi:hypothetical protein